MLGRVGLGKRCKKPYAYGGCCSCASSQGRRRINIDGIEEGRSRKYDGLGRVRRRDRMFEARCGIAIEDVRADGSEDDIE